MPQLGVNLDHVATLRQARYRREANPTTGSAAAPGASPFSLAEPDPVRAVQDAELGGADVITLHLREDRRHVNDRDVELVREVARVPLNLEMAATDEMVAIALRIRPAMCTLVPEGRMEVTTEGGLDVHAQRDRLRQIVARLVGGGIAVSAFIDPEEKQVRASAQAGFQACELHTGPYALAFAQANADDRAPVFRAALSRLVRSGAACLEEGMRLNAGHALNYANVGPVGMIPDLWQLHIGHSIVSRAVFVGLREAIAQMKLAMFSGGATLDDLEL
ncbi:MAG: pyridoxine 5'-phosphate synthase [Planctomycetota bacterium]|nr:pyridoxine 5'-phosphate synthase [Planctomycetota bacterium]